MRKIPGLAYAALLRPAFAEKPNTGGAQETLTTKGTPSLGEILRHRPKQEGTGARGQPWNALFSPAYYHVSREKQWIHRSDVS